MFSGLIPGLNSVNAPEYELSVQIPASLLSLVNKLRQSLPIEACCGSNDGIFAQFLAFFQREWSGLYAQLEWRTLVLFFVYVGIVITIGLIARSHMSSGDDLKLRGKALARPAGELTGPDVAATLGARQRLGDDLSYSSPLFSMNGKDIVSESDAMYAEELQVQEALMLSLVSAGMYNEALSSSIQTTPICNGEPSRSLCGICFEENPGCKMFRNGSCSHSFCHDCTSKYIAAKIQDNAKTIFCPEVDCKAVMDFDACREIIPREVLVRWDENLCKSLIPESQTLYCPFRDCSAMLLNDSGEVIKMIKCPACHRLICAKCRVPWHTEFSCKDFQRLTAGRKGKDDILIKELAKKKSWRKCSNCKVYVEKTEGCIHMTCRCKFEFCYRCGSKWSSNHNSCTSRS